MVRARVTERDESLPHQISLRFVSGMNSRTHVFCNCRIEPLGQMDNTGNPWVIYNNPANHVGDFKPRERHTMNVKVYEVE